MSNVIPIGAAASKARELARRPDDRFGLQDHAEAPPIEDLTGGTQQPGPTPSDEHPVWGRQHPATASRRLEPFDVRAAAIGSRPAGLAPWPPTALDAVDDRHIRAALRAHQNETRTLRAGFAPGAIVDGQQQRRDFAALDAHMATVANTALTLAAEEKRITGGAPERSSTNPNLSTGAKYTGYRDAVQVAKDVGADLKAAYQVGLLPPGTEVSVQVRKYAGGQSLDLTVRGMRDADLYEPAGEDGFRNMSWYAKDVQALVGRVAGSYNRRDVDTMADYFNVTYHCNMRIEDERSARWRAADKDRRAAQATWRAAQRGGQDLEAARTQARAAQAAYDAAISRQ